MNFYSANSYIFLPTKKNPKVALCIDNTTLVNNAFKLYNPFSLKAKILKSVSRFFFTTLNIFIQQLGTKKEKSNFIIYLEKLLDKELHVSLYFATANDKIVLQLQSSEEKVIGYLKYPINDIGLKHIKNEIKAFEILSDNGIVESYILSDIYDDKPFLLLRELNGTIDKVEKQFIETILKSFEKDSSYQLIIHPRIVKLKDSLIKNNMLKYLTILENMCDNSNINYKVVYEHGDFTPWNIIKVKDDYIPFDFEYFVEDGLEYFDIIKYYYQVGKLLESKKDKELLEYIIDNVKIQEIKELFTLFLIKEIIRQKEENDSFEFEEIMINIMEWKK